MLFRVVILNGPNSGQRITVSEAPMTIGRGADCALVLDDPDMALAHAELHFEKGQLFVVDLGAMTKTLVNQREVQKVRLQHGDILEVGRTRLLVEAHVPAEVPAAKRNATRRRAKRTWAWAALVLALSAAAVYIGIPRPAEEPDIQAGAADSDRPDSLSDIPESPALVERAEPDSDAWFENEAAFDVHASSSAEADERVGAELRLLRGDLERIRDAVAVLVETREMSLLPAGADSAANAQADALQTLLERAAAELDQGRLEEAGHLLEGLYVLAPDFIPGWEVRARLFEQFGQWKRAEQEWARVEEHSEQEETRQRARDEQARLAQRRREEEAASISFHIASLHQRKFPERDGIQEMRTVTVGLVPEDPYVSPDPSAVSVEVVFYERDLAEGRVFPSPRVAPVWMRPEGEWDAGEQKSLVATYRIDRLQPDDATIPALSPSMAFVGYRVRVYVRDELASEVFRPVTLAYLPDATEASVRTDP